MLWELQAPSNGLLVSINTVNRYGPDSNYKEIVTNNIFRTLLATKLILENMNDSTDTTIRYLAVFIFL